MLGSEMYACTKVAYSNAIVSKINLADKPAPFTSFANTALPEAYTPYQGG